MTHRWSARDPKDDHTTHRCCEKCGMTKVTRHEGHQHWAEFYRVDGARIHYGDRTPPCEPERTAAIMARDSARDALRQMTEDA